MDDLRFKKEVWKGALPMCITLANHDIASLEQPSPMYLMLSRLAYLSLSLDKMIEHFEPYTQEGFQRDEIWLSYNGTPLRWQYSVGALADIHGGVNLQLPWMLQIHFRAFPTDVLIPYQGIKSLRVHFVNSLKESTALLLGSAQSVMTMSKDSEERLWRSLIDTDFDRFWELMERTYSLEPVEVKRVPVKAFTNEVKSGMILQPVACFRMDGQLLTIGEQISHWLEPRGVREVICQGIAVPENTPVFWLWKTMAHADGFLYLVISAPLPS